MGFGIFLGLLNVTFVSSIMSISASTQRIKNRQIGKSYQFEGSRMIHSIKFRFIVHSGSMVSIKK